METLHNELLTVEVSDLGAELQSIKDDEGKEYLWQGDDRYWGRRSPILFPIVCGLWKGTYRTEGDTYQMGRHGFARDMNFRVLKKADDRVTYVLSDTEVSFNAPCVGIWTPYGKNAPFLCIEPWYGVHDHYEYRGQFRDKYLMNHLQPGASFMSEYIIKIGE